MKTSMTMTSMESIKSINMKRLISLTIVLFFCVIVFAQGQNPIDNFKIQDKEVYWQKIYPTDLNFKQLVSSIKNSLKLKDIEIGENKITGYSTLFSSDPTGAGYSCGRTRIYVCSYDIQGHVIVDLKEGKYRVTFRQIILKDKNFNLNQSLSKDKPFETYALNGKKEKFSSHFIKSPHKIYDYTFLKEFEIKQIKEEEW